MSSKKKVQTGGGQADGPNERMQAKEENRKRRGTHEGREGGMMTGMWTRAEEVRQADGRDGGENDGEVEKRKAEGHCEKQRGPFSCAGGGASGWRVI